MFYKPFSISAIALLAATGASAQSTEYLTYGLGYSDLSGAADLSVLSGTVGLDYRSGDLVANGTALVFRVDEGGSRTVVNIDATLGYFITSNFVAYGGLTYFDDGPNDDTNFSIGGEYMTGPFTVGLNVVDGDDFIDPSISLYGSYQIANGIEAGLFFADIENDMVTSVALDYDAGPLDMIALYTEDDGDDLFAFDGKYEFGGGLRALGSYVSLDGDDAYSIGAGYEVSDNLWIDASFGQIDDGADTADTISIGVSFETGRETLLIDRTQTLQLRSVGSLVGIN